MKLFGKFFGKKPAVSKNFPASENSETQVDHPDNSNLPKTPPKPAPSSILKISSDSPKNVQEPPVKSTSSNFQYSKITQIKCETTITTKTTKVIKRSKISTISENYVSSNSSKNQNSTSIQLKPPSTPKVVRFDQQKEKTDEKQVKNKPLYQNSALSSGRCGYIDLRGNMISGRPTDMQFMSEMDERMKKDAVLAEMEKRIKNKKA